MEYPIKFFDWRFLLPKLELNCIGVIGSEDEQFLEQLQNLFKSLKIIKLMPSNVNLEIAEEFDLIISRSFNLSNIEKNLKFLKSGGFIYVEIDRRKNMKKIVRKFIPKGKVKNLEKFDLKTSLNHFNLQYYCSVLHELGMRNIETYWHRPNFGTCREIITLEDKNILEFIFSRPQNNFLGKVKSFMGEYLGKTRFLINFASCISLIARKQ